MAQVRFIYNQGEANEYVFPYAFHITDPEPGMKATIIRGTRGDGSIAIPGGKKSQEIHIRGKIVKIYLYLIPSTLSIPSFQLYGMIHYPIWNLISYLKCGISYFSYRQDIQSEFTRLKVDHHKWTTILGGGIRLEVLAVMQTCQNIFGPLGFPFPRSLPGRIQPSRGSHKYRHPYSLPLVCVFLSVQ